MREIIFKFSRNVWRKETSNTVVPSVYSVDREIRDQLPGDPWIHFRNGYFEVYFID
jgi:hypothetical protein